MKEIQFEYWSDFYLSCEPDSEMVVTVTLDEEEENLFREALAQFDDYDFEEHVGENKELEERYSGMFLFFHKVLPGALAEKICDAVTQNFAQIVAESDIKYLYPGWFYLFYSSIRERFSEDEWFDLDVTEQAKVYLEVDPDILDDCTWDVTDARILTETDKKKAFQKFYHIVEKDNLYEIHKGDKVLKTSHGKIANTEYKELAERLLKDWKQKGYDSCNEPDSILIFHFSALDYCNILPRELLISSLLDINKLIPQLNFSDTLTFKDCPSDDPDVKAKWELYFGNGENRVERIRKWLDNCTTMQLSAISCACSTFSDFNIVYYLAYVVEEYDKREHYHQIIDFYDFCEKFEGIIDRKYYFDRFWDIFKCFRLYYGIHLKEFGKHLPK